MDIGLKEKIEELRIEMYRILQGRTFSDPEVVKVSESLDQVLNQYQKFVKFRYNQGPRMVKVI